MNRHNTLQIVNCQRLIQILVGTAILIWKHYFNPAKNFQIWLLVSSKDYLGEYFPILPDRYVLPVWVFWQKKSPINRYEIWHRRGKSRLKDIVMQIGNALTNDRLCVSKVSWKFCIQTIYNFAVIFHTICYFLKKYPTF